MVLYIYIYIHSFRTVDTFQNKMTPSLSFYWWWNRENCCPKILYIMLRFHQNSTKTTNRPNTHFGKTIIINDKILKIYFRRYFYLICKIFDARAHYNTYFFDHTKKLKKKLSFFFDFVAFLFFEKKIKKKKKVKNHRQMTIFFFLFFNFLLLWSKK